MTTAAWVCIGIGGVLAGADWVAVALGRRVAEYVCKPAAIAALIVAAAVLQPAHASARPWFVAALALSLAGDVFLMLPADLFVPGLAAFLLAHIAYIVGLVSLGGPTRWLLAAVPVVAIAAVTIGGRVLAEVRRGAEPALMAPVALYMAVISATVACALAYGPWIAGGAAVSFYLSDALIAWDRFVDPVPHARVAIMTTYHLAQFGFVASLVR